MKRLILSLPLMVGLSLQSLGAQEAGTPAAPANAIPNLARQPEGRPAPAPQSQARRTVDAVLADPVFGKEVEEWQWRPKRNEEKREESQLPAWQKMVMRIVEWISKALRWIGWGVAALVAAGFIYLLLRYRQAWWPESGKRAPLPDFLFGLDVRPDSLPDDVAAAARELLAAGRVREALSLLYRGALVALIHDRQVVFRDGDTEEDCLARLGGHLDASGENYFRRLLQAWRQVAYAHRAPADDELQALCAGWAQHFRPGAR